VHSVISHLYADPEDPACRSRYIQVHFYPTPEALQAAARRYSAGRGDKDAFLDTLGVFHPSPWKSRYDKRQRRWVDITPAFAGVMRLCRPALDARVIAHEAAHAALHILRLHDWSKEGHSGVADLGDNCGPHEEAFAYLLGDLTGTLTQLAAAYKRSTRPSEVAP
jgi:hypothetical protein